MSPHWAGGDEKGPPNKVIRVDLHDLGRLQALGVVGSERIVVATAIRMAIAQLEDEVSGLHPRVAEDFIAQPVLRNP